MGNISMKKRVNACADVGIPSIVVYRVFLKISHGCRHSRMSNHVMILLLLVVITTRHMIYREF